MTNANSPSAGDKRKLRGTDSSRPEKSQKSDDKVQTTLDDTVTRQVPVARCPATLTLTLIGYYHQFSDKKGEAESASREENSQNENNQDENNQDENNQDENQAGQSHDSEGEVDVPKPKEKGKGKETAVDPRGREGSTPSTMLEKGVIYFFLRGRIGIDYPDKVADIARTFILLRPVPEAASLVEGPIGDAGNARLIAIPKKKLPKTGRDRWIAFVDKTNASFEELKNDFLPANDYETKTAGVRHSPPAVPLGQGVYAITTTGRESHLAYMLTLPHKLGQVQTTIGLQDKGSWILSTRNPQYPAPSSIALPEGPEYSQEILDGFRSLRWMGTVPEHLVPNAQILLVGESSGIQKAMEPDDKDEEDEDKNEPMEEMEELEHENVQRMQHLGKTDSDAIFLDLEAFERGHPEIHLDF